MVWLLGHNYLMLSPPLVSLITQMVKNLPALWETWVQSLDREDPLGTHCSPASPALAYEGPSGCSMAKGHLLLPSRPSKLLLSSSTALTCREPGKGRPPTGLDSRVKHKSKGTSIPLWVCNTSKSQTQPWAHLLRQPNSLC